jgi:hypothetical protein
MEPLSYDFIKNKQRNLDGYYILGYYGMDKLLPNYTAPHPKKTVQCIVTAVRTSYISQTHLPPLFHTFM